MPLRRLGCGVLLIAAFAVAACDRIYRMKRTARVTVLPAAQCVETALRSLDWVADTASWVDRGSDDNGPLTHIVAITAKGGLNFSVSTVDAGDQRSFEMYWARLNRGPTVAEVATLNGRMDAAYNAVSQGCGTLPDPGNVVQECDGCPG
jgi:hypothetical protein